MGTTWGHFGRHEASVRSSLESWYSSLDRALKRGMARSGIPMARVAMGIVFFWFGVLKFFPGLSPAQDLASRTISVLTFGWVGPTISLPMLAAWECAIGLGFLTGKYLRATLLLLFLQMAGTMLPILFFPHETFTVFPIAPTMEGQYIIKNLVLISAGLIIGATVDGGFLSAKAPVEKDAQS